MESSGNRNKVVGRKEQEQLERKTEGKLPFGGMYSGSWSWDCFASLLVDILILIQKLMGCWDWKGALISIENLKCMQTAWKVWYAYFIFMGTNSLQFTNYT